MLSKVIDFFRSPEYEDFEQTQKAKFLHITLLIVAGTCFIMALLNMGETHLDEFLFLISSISFLCIPANKSGYYLPVVILLAFLALGVMTFALIDGVGLKDAGMLSYPIFIIFVSYLLNKKAAFFAVILSMSSVVFVYYLDRMGYLDPAKYANENQLKAICVLLVAVGCFQWVVTDNWERILQNLRDTYDLTLIGWGKALEFRDQETEGHSQRVVEMTLLLAKQLGIPTGKMVHIRRGALLHDIGKMAVPDSILLKKGSLTDNELEIIKMHPINARKLLENIPYLKPALDIPYSHHERWDGSGYPERLSKEDIPLAARIFAVVDVWDALTSDRPYRQAWSQEKARDYIRDQSGKLFDPQVAGAFLKLVESGKNLEQ